MRAAPGPDQILLPSTSQASTAPTHGATAPGSPVCIPSEQLFAGAQEVQISHQGMRYRLKKTALGKLILTK